MSDTIVLQAYILRNTKTGRWYKRRCRTRGKSYGKITTTAERNLACGVVTMAHAEHVKSLMTVPDEWEIILSV